MERTQNAAPTKAQELPLSGASGPSPIPSNTAFYAPKAPALSRRSPPPAVPSSTDSFIGLCGQTPFPGPGVSALFLPVSPTGAQ